MLGCSLWGALPRCELKLAPTHQGQGVAQEKGRWLADWQVAALISKGTYEAYLGWLQEE